MRLYLYAYQYPRVVKNVRVHFWKTRREIMKERARGCFIKRPVKALNLLEYANYRFERTRLCLSPFL